MGEARRRKALEGEFSTAQPTIAVPPRFMRTLSEQEWLEVMFSSLLNGEQCQRLWRMEGYPGPPPATLRILLNGDDLDRVIEGRGFGIEVRGLLEH